MEITILVVGIVVRPVMGLVVGVVIRPMVRAVVGLVVGVVVRIVIGFLVRLVARVERFFVRTIRLIIRIVIGTLMRLVVRFVVRAVRLVVRFVCLSEFQYAFAIFIIDVACLESRVDVRPLFIITFCPSFVVEVIEVVSPTPSEFTCCYIVVLYLNPIDFSSCYVCISKRIQLVPFIPSPDSHDEVLWLS